MRPSLKKQASASAGSEIVVWRRPVGMPQPTGGEEHAVTGSTPGTPSSIGGGCPASAYLRLPLAASYTATATVA